MRSSALVALFALLVPTVASAAEADAGGAIETAQADLDRAYGDALSQSCDLACRALESLRRAADHLCALDPGDRCAKAQEKVRSANEHVRSSCPDCASALEAKRGTAQPQAAQPQREETTVAAEQAAPSKRGGCAGCTVARQESAQGAWAASLLALLALRRRRSSRS